LASAAGVAVLLANGPAARRAAVAGAALEFGAAQAVERRMGRTAKKSRLSKVATGATLAGGALCFHRRTAAPGGVLLLTGAAAERFAIFHAGVDSARDPRATIAPQRQRLDRPSQ